MLQTNLNIHKKRIAYDKISSTLDSHVEGAFVMEHIYHSK